MFVWQLVFLLSKKSILTSLLFQIWNVHNNIWKSIKLVLDYRDASSVLQFIFVPWLIKNAFVLSHVTFVFLKKCWHSDMTLIFSNIRLLLRDARFVYAFFEKKVSLPLSRIHCENDVLRVRREESGKRSGNASRQMELALDNVCSFA